MRTFSMFECVNNSNNLDDCKIVYFDTTGNIQSIENRIIQDSENIYVYFRTSDISIFLDGTTNIDDYHIIYKNDTMSYHIVRKDSKKLISIKNNFTKKLEIHKEPTIMIDITYRGFSFQLVEDILGQTELLKRLNQNFYVTLYEEPDFIIDTINLNYENLISGERYLIDYQHKYNKISMYITQELLKTYSLEDKRIA